MNEIQIEEMLDPIDSTYVALARSLTKEQVAKKHSRYLSYKDVTNNKDFLESLRPGPQREAAEMLRQVQELKELHHKVLATRAAVLQKNNETSQEVVRIMQSTNDWLMRQVSFKGEGPVRQDQTGERREMERFLAKVTTRRR
jgi:hypothetical protein